MIKLKDLITERINVRKWINAVNKGEDVVVYDKKGKRYNLQGGDNKSVQVTDHWEDAGRRNVHPESTWQTLPLSKVKKIVSEAIGKGMFWKDLKNGTTIEYTGGTKYVVIKVDNNKLQMTLKSRGKVGGGLFAPKAMLDKSGFESQVKTGLIKYLVNTNPREVKEGKLNEENKWSENWWNATSSLSKAISWVRALTYAPKVPDVIKKDAKLDRLTKELDKQYDRIEKYVDKMGYDNLNEG